MADNQKYYYMRLKDSFFDSDEMILLESMQDGYIYQNILMKMYLRSLKDNGKLVVNNIIPYNPQMLATVTRHQIGTIDRAIDIFKKLGLIEILDDGTIYMLNIQNYIGKSSTEAERIASYRKEIESRKENCTNVQLLYDKSTPKIEKDTDTKNNKNIEDIESVVLYLNEKAHTNYNATTDSTKKHINARLNEGFTVEQLKKVIDNKCAEWLSDNKMRNFLRPETLFGPKFEGYLNQHSYVNDKSLYNNDVLFDGL